MKNLTNTLLSFDIMDICSRFIVSKLNSHLNKEGLEFEKLRLGVDVIILSLSKLILIFVLSIFFNTFVETFVMIISHSLLRRTAFGLHAKNSNVCLIITVLMFVTPPILLNNIHLNFYIIIAIFLVFNLILYKYAPADTENHPLLGASLRKQLKTKTWVTGNILMVVTLLIPIDRLKPLIILSVFYIILTILPVTYKILKRRCNNYEIYE
jgi:accessory gene regulator B